MNTNSEAVNQRQAAILQALGERGRVSVEDLAARLGVSGMTVRRDLTELEKRGLLVRTHGGALPRVPLALAGVTATPQASSPEKIAIGRRAAALVEPGQTVMVDSGTTALEVARHLPADPSITVATVSLVVAWELYRSPLQVLLLGGFLRRDFPSLYGPLTQGNLADLTVDLLFIGCDGARSDDGFYTVDLHVSSLERAMIGIAQRVVVVTESAKFERRAFARFAAPDEVHTLVTDPGLPEADRRRLRKKGVEIILAE